jgi:hypothetical protein
MGHEVVVAVTEGLLDFGPEFRTVLYWDKAKGLAAITVLVATEGARGTGLGEW